MPSIFIWKSNKPNISKKQIRYYSGSNWVVEDDDNLSKSYMFIDQIVIPGLNNSVITYHTKNMPQDWVGSELLEVSLVPYEQIKSDSYGILDMIGEWTRFISTNDVNFDEETLKNEYIKIQNWINEPINENKPKNQKTITNHSNNKNYNHKQNYKTNQHNLDNEFKDLLIKYSIPIDMSISEVNLTTQKILNSNKLKNNKNKNNKNINRKSY
jgi:hypothetical protein